MLSKLFSREKTSQKSNRWIFGTMLTFGIIGLISALVLSIERIHLLEHPGVSLSCDFNLLFNCGTVMQTWQAKLFGFPNPFIGLMGYSVVITVAVIGLLRAQLPRAFWVAAQIGYGLGLIFAYWLFYNSVFVIQVLCPWCLVVTFSTTLIFETLLRFNLQQNNFGLKKATHAKVLGFLKKDYDKFATAVWLVANIFLILIVFRDSIF